MNSKAVEIIHDHAERIENWASSIGEQDVHQLQGELWISYFMQIVSGAPELFDAIAIALGPEHAEDFEKKIVNLGTRCLEFDEGNREAHGIAHYYAYDLSESLRRRVHLVFGDTTHVESELGGSVLSRSLEVLKKSKPNWIMAGDIADKTKDKPNSIRARLSEYMRNLGDQSDVESGDLGYRIQPDD